MQSAAVVVARVSIFRRLTLQEPINCVSVICQSAECRMSVLSRLWCIVNVYTKSVCQVRFWWGWSKILVYILVSVWLCWLLMHSYLLRGPGLAPASCSKYLDQMSLVVFSLWEMCNTVWTVSASPSTGTQRKDWFYAVLFREGAIDKWGAI